MKFVSILFLSNMGWIIANDIEESTCRGLYPYLNKSLNLSWMDNNALLNESYRWPNGVIPFEINRNYGLQEEWNITKAMIVYHKTTCIRFIQRTLFDKDWIHITREDWGCYSKVGRIGGRQIVNLEPPNCLRMEVILHELMHAIGFIHEHSRWDRDNYINIHTENIRKGTEENFLKVKFVQRDFSYDYESLMHYGQYAFSKNGKPTITSKKRQVITKPKVLSKKDIDKNIMEGGIVGEDLTLPPCKYEYLDHTADVQLHSWGDSLAETFEQCGLSMFGYMTNLETVEIKDVREIQANGHDLESLLFHFLDELLFLFSCEPYLICSKLVITEFLMEGEDFTIRCKCYGEEFTLGKHPQGTEVKAITYSAMQIVNEPTLNKYEKYKFQCFSSLTSGSKRSSSHNNYNEEESKNECLFVNESESEDEDKVNYNLNEMLRKWSVSFNILHIVILGLLTVILSKSVNRLHPAIAVLNLDDFHYLIPSKNDAVNVADGLSTTSMDVVEAVVPDHKKDVVRDHKNKKRLR
ncbi:hypothetical protein FQA39_LY16964 [Lamprigera yunnana]|nr:hypothetical protein FQA39_LY16964 [Lamprigera yunnana]